MWTSIVQPGVMSNVVDFTAVFAPVLWGLIAAAVLPAVAIVGMAVREYWAQPPTQQEEPGRAEVKLAA
jgi:hypothetical protein